MTGDEPNIERIVAEVLRRLMRLADAPAQAAPGPEAPANVPANVPVNAPAPPPPAPAPMRQQDARQQDDLWLDVRVVTTATVVGRLAGVRRVRVAPGTVVTPSVKDDLRKRGIRLEVAAVADCSPSAADLTVARCLRTPEAMRAAATLPLPRGGREGLFQELGQALACVAQSVGADGQVAVLLTDDPLAAVCLLNRRSEVRAAQARSVEDVRQAILAIGTNVLVVDPRGVTANQWHAMVQELRKDPPRGCPPMLQAGLV